MGIFKKSCGLSPQSNRPVVVGSPSVSVFPQVTVNIPPMPAPNPARFEIRRLEQVGADRVVAEVHYPDCTNYEGNKILLFVGMTERGVREMKTMDPHFSPTQVCPFARFEPTKRGWEWAIYLADRMGIEDVTREDEKS